MEADNPEGAQDHFQGVLRLEPWPVLLVMEPEGDGTDAIEVPYALVTPELAPLEGLDLRLLNGKLIEIMGVASVSGPARMITTKLSSFAELEGSLGTPGRAAESSPADLGEYTITGRMFTLPFLARNGRKLPEPDDSSAISTQQEQLKAGLPVVLLASAETLPKGLRSPLLLLTGAVSPLDEDDLMTLLNRETTFKGRVDVQGAWQVLKVDVTSGDTTE